MSKLIDIPNLANIVLPAFWRMWKDVKEHGHTHYWLHGGRGSTKSSFISTCIVLLIVTFPFANAVVIRKVAVTLRGSVYGQVAWAIDMLGLNSLFRENKTLMEYVYIPTGQKIVFKGSDSKKDSKGDKAKGAVFVHGYCAIIWFEEADQFDGIEEIRSILNSYRRGGEKFWIFYSYNPPKIMWSWVNKECLARLQRDDTLVHASSYLDVAATHPEWLGQPFIDEAEYLKETNYPAYAWEYLGEITGTGGSVFENITVRAVTDEEIYTFDNHKNGVDFGWFPDPWRFIQTDYKPADKRVIIYGERSANKMLPRDTGNIIRAALTYKDKKTDKEPRYHHETFYCDSVDKTQITAYRKDGLNARPADKGNMRKQSYYWLAGLREIVIDPVRCPLTYEEFKLCEFSKNRQGEWMDDFNDGNDHSIDAVRYAYMDTIIRGR